MQTEPSRAGGAIPRLFFYPPRRHLLPVSAGLLMAILLVRRRLSPSPDRERRALRPAPDDLCAPDASARQHGPRDEPRERALGARDHHGPRALPASPRHRRVLRRRARARHGAAWRGSRPDRARSLSPGIRGAEIAHPAHPPAGAERESWVGVVHGAPENVCP